MSHYQIDLTDLGGGRRSWVEGEWRWREWEGGREGQGVEVVLPSNMAIQ